MRALYLEVATLSARLVGHPSVGQRWEQESALRGFAVSGLAGHLARAILQVEWYLDAELPDAQLINASQYYAGLTGLDRPDSELNVGIRHRGEETASGGPDALARQTEAALARLRVRLPAEPSDRRVGAALGWVLLLDEYLKTRVVEMTVHIDDLASSVGLPPPELPAEAYDVAIDTLVGVATLRHGHLAVLRALSRRERQGPEILQVL